MASKQQERLLAHLNMALPNFDFKCDYRPEFMLHESTGKNFEIDIYCEKHKIGFEFQGAVHFADLKKYRNDSDKSRLHDHKKSDIIESKSGKICVVEVFESDLSGDVISNVADRCLNTANYYARNKLIGKASSLFNFQLGLRYNLGYGFTFSTNGVCFRDATGFPVKSPEGVKEDRLNWKRSIAKYVNERKSEQINKRAAKMEKSRKKNRLKWLKKKHASANIGRVINHG